MEQFEIDQTRENANKLFMAREESRIPGAVSFCCRCSRMLERCECSPKCSHGEHTETCECIDIVNLAYRIARAELKATPGGYIA